MTLLESMRLDGKRALVTGAGHGIGKGCALEFARAGAELVLNDRPGSATLPQTAEEIRGLGVRCWTVEGDVFAVEGGAAIVEQAVGLAGTLDILISNPAYGKRCSFLDFPADEFDRVTEATYKSGFRISQAVARHMVQQRIAGKILFISSVVAMMPFERNVPYGAAKAALNQLVQGIAVELFAHRINVNAIAPGWIDTPTERAAFSDEVIEAQGRSLPWGRMGTPEDIGRAAAFLVSNAADYITGVVLPVDGGFRFKDMLAACGPQEIDPA